MLCLLIVEKCPAAVVEIEAQAGIFVEGSVSPAIADLTVEVTDGEKVVATGVTDQTGKYM